MISSWPLLLSITGLVARSYIAGGTGNGVARFSFIITSSPHWNIHRKATDKAKTTMALLVIWYWGHAKRSNKAFERYLQVSGDEMRDFYATGRGNIIP